MKKGLKVEETRKPRFFDENFIRLSQGFAMVDSPNNSTLCQLNSTGIETSETTGSKYQNS